MKDNSAKEEDVFVKLQSLLRLAGDPSVRGEIAGYLLHKLKRLTTTFDDVGTASSTTNLIVFYHVQVSEKSKVISSFDIKPLDQSVYDYEALLNLNIRISGASNPNAHIILVTDTTSLNSINSSKNLTVLRFSDLQADHPMFERVVVMNSIVSSSLIRHPIVFLDSDAFLLRPITLLFNDYFDVGVTHRAIVGQMPINEGVIFVNNRDISMVRRFFLDYLEKYLGLELNRIVNGFYKDLRRWRGGQLSLNGIAGSTIFHRTGLTILNNGVRLLKLPCSRFNFSEIDKNRIDSALLRQLVVLHLKGPRKDWVDGIYQLEREHFPLGSF